MKKIILIITAVLLFSVAMAGCAGADVAGRISAVSMADTSGSAVVSGSADTAGTSILAGTTWVISKGEMNGKEITLKPFVDAMDDVEVVFSDEKTYMIMLEGKEQEEGSYVLKGSSLILDGHIAASVSDNEMVVKMNQDGLAITIFFIEKK